jgi:hypothetical protein
MIMRQQLREKELCLQRKDHEIETIRLQVQELQL